MLMTTGTGRGFTGTDAVDSDEFNFAGASYKWNDELTTAYHYGALDNFYQQHYLSAVHVLPLGDQQSLKSDIRFARSTDDGNTNVDNKAFGAMFTYGLGGHALGLGYQQMNGDTGFAYIDGSDPFLVNFVQINDFANADERSWQARYDYDFAALGVPGLSFLARYVSGDDAEIAGSKAEGNEWERDLELTYVVQSGPLKDVIQAPAQRQLPFRLRPRRGRKPGDRRLHPADLVNLAASRMNACSLPTGRHEEFLVVARMQSGAELPVPRHPGYDGKPHRHEKARRLAGFFASACASVLALAPILWIDRSAP